MSRQNQSFMCILSSYNAPKFYGSWGPINVFLWPSNDRRLSSYNTQHQG